MDTIDDVLSALKQGQPVVVLDDENRENEGDLIMAGEFVTPDWMNFYCNLRGKICAAISRDKMKQLGMKMMVPQEKNTTTHGTPFALPVDVKHGVTSGISVEERARTVQWMTRDDSTPDDFMVPGHVDVLVARDGGVLERDGHTEAGVNLMKLANLKPVALICEILDEFGHPRRLESLKLFAEENQFRITTIALLIQYCQMCRAMDEQKNPMIEISRSNLSNKWSDDAQVKIFKRNDNNSVEQTVLCYPYLSDKSYYDPSKVYLRIHSGCHTGDVLKSKRCDCGEQWEEANSRISATGGFCIYLNDHEGRGIGLGNKIKAYYLQDEEGLDTVDANIRLGFKEDERRYDEAILIMKALGITPSNEIHLFTDNPNKISALKIAGFNNVVHETMNHPVNTANKKYLKTKCNRMHHLYDL